METQLVVKVKADTLNRLLVKAVNADDSFRQWFYPDLPKSYKVNKIIINTIKSLANRGFYPEEIIKHLMEVFNSICHT